MVQLLSTKGKQELDFLHKIESPEEVKWELGLAGFATFRHTGTGICSLGMGKKC